MIILKLISRLPFWALYAISDIMFFFGYYIFGYRRQMVSQNLANAFPEKSETERKAIAKAFYKNVCDYVVEMFKLLTISEEELDRRMKYVDITDAQRHANNNQSVIVLASHQFNWEWLVAASNFRFPVPIDYVYQPQSNEIVDGFTNYGRARFGSYPIKRDAVARESIRRKNILRGIAIVADQYPGLSTDKKFSARFMNRDTVFFQGVNQLGVLMQYPVLFARIIRVRRGYYEVSFPEIATPPYTKDSTVILNEYIKHTEQLIREHPSGWLWSHNRWKVRHLKSSMG